MARARHRNGCLEAAAGDARAGLRFLSSRLHTIRRPRDTHPHHRELGPPRRKVFALAGWLDRVGGGGCRLDGGGRLRVCAPRALKPGGRQVRPWDPARFHQVDGQEMSSAAPGNPRERQLRV